MFDPYSIFFAYVPTQYVLLNARLRGGVGVGEGAQSSSYEHKIQRSTVMVKRFEKFHLN